MDISRENEYLLYLAVQSVRGGRVMTLPEGQDYASLFSRAGQAGIFRAVAGGFIDDVPKVRAGAVCMLFEHVGGAG